MDSSSMESMVSTVTWKLTVVGLSGGLCWSYVASSGRRSCKEMEVWRASVSVSWPCFFWPLSKNNRMNVSNLFFQPMKLKFN